ncbi:MAG: ankyrin repeat domain-containing protein [Oligoflexia bacterium]|nr:ankyrin repeat domain-containing protein [Oligoflexia bacterium]
MKTKITFTIILFAIFFISHSFSSEVKTDKKTEPRDIYDNTPLSLAIKNNNTEMAKLLINNGTKINSRNYVGNTPLIMAATNGNFQIIKTLFEKGVLDNLKNLEDQTALDIVIKTIKDKKNILKTRSIFHTDKYVKYQKEALKLNIEIATWMKEAIKLRKSPKGINDAIKKKDFNEIKKYLQAGVNLEVKTFWHNDTPLIKAVRVGDLKIITALLDHGANPTVINSKQETPLSLAEKNGDKDIIEAIKKAQINFKAKKTTSTSTSTSTVSSDRDLVSFSPIVTFKDPTVTKFWGNQYESTTSRALKFIPRVIGNEVKSVFTGKTGTAIAKLAQSPYYFGKTLIDKTQIKKANSKLDNLKEFKKELQSEVQDLKKQIEQLTKDRDSYLNLKKDFLAKFKKMKSISSSSKNKMNELLSKFKIKLNLQESLESIEKDNFNIKKFNDKISIPLYEKINEQIKFLSNKYLDKKIEYEMHLSEILRKHPQIKSPLKINNEIDNTIAAAVGCLGNSILNPFEALNSVISDITTIIKLPLHGHQRMSERIKLCTINLLSPYYLSSYKPGYTEREKMHYLEDASKPSTISPAAKVTLKKTGMALAQQFNPATHVAVVVDNGEFHNVDNIFDHGTSSSTDLDMRYLNCQSLPIANNESESLIIERLHCLGHYYSPGYNFFLYNCGGHAKDLVEMAGLSQIGVTNFGIGSNMSYKDVATKYIYKKVQSTCNNHIFFTQKLIEQLESGSDLNSDIVDYFNNYKNSNVFGPDFQLQLIISAVRGKNITNRAFVEKLIPAYSTRFSFYLKDENSKDISKDIKVKSSFKSHLSEFSELLKGKEIDSKDLEWLKTTYPAITKILQIP